jgi:hypothetical protein
MQARLINRWIMLAVDDDVPRLAEKQQSRLWIQSLGESYNKGLGPQKLGVTGGTNPSAV